MHNSATPPPAAPPESHSFFATDVTSRQKLTIRKIFLLGLLLLIGGGGLLVAPWRGLVHAGHQSVGPLPVSTLAVEPVKTYQRLRSYTGLLRERRRSQLGFQRAGEVVELLVDEGARVAAGQVLARLDDRHILAAQAQVAAQVAEAEAVLAELVAGPRSETIEAKQAELQAQQAQVAVLAGQLARRKKLLSSTSVSREEYETFLFDYRAAQARAKVVERQLSELRTGTRVEKISAQRARLASLQAGLVDIQHDVADTTLTAPFAGHVSQRMVDEGQVIRAGSAVFEIVDDSRLEAWVGVPPSAARALQLGAECQLTVDGQPFHAELLSLGPDVERATRTRNVILGLQKLAVGLVPGQVARLAISETVVEAGYWVPTTALARGLQGLWSVYVVEEREQESVIARRHVELLDTFGDHSFVRGTLQPGDLVVASGTHRVVVGQQVTIVAQDLGSKVKS